MNDSNPDNHLFRSVIAEFDVILLILFFASMIVVANDYHPVAREFPVLFLKFGLAAMILELIVLILPEQYSQQIQRLTTGLAADMDSEIDLEEEDSISEGEQTAEYKTFALALGLIISFGILSIYISFLLAIPVFVFGSIYLLGSGNFANAAITTAVLLLGIYTLFGQMMNVPVSQGELIDLDPLLRTVLTIGGI